MLAELAIVAVQGVSTVLTDRFLNRGDTSASIRSVLTDLAEIKELQAQDRATLVELRHLTARVLARTDGLEISRREICFVPTPNTPDVHAALLNLELEISRLEAEIHPPVAQAHIRSDARASIFYQLDEEIANLRSGRETGR
ncbi:hypothetical protein [Nocardia bovistercoris]|uniref:Uncharacterized protein n=1 Tax=Nocardia bovistercoris TaxID=2785916 RepID=A0A931I9M7_9NOCA|nr:hypothetical protein [Nocardia bovistercoris]MBH0776611.1 hypothetical protein [Nocardia bovistercoris]